MYIVMLIEQHVKSYRFVENESDVVAAGIDLLKLCSSVALSTVKTTGTSPGLNAYGEPNRIMYADVIEIRAARVRTGLTYYSMD